MKFIRNLLICILLGALIFSNICYADKSDIKKVFISQVAEHPALDATTRGIIDALAQHNYQRGKNLDLRVESAQSNGALAAQIANKFVQQQPDVVVAVGTLTAQSFVKYAVTKKVTLIFASVTDPLSTHIVKSIVKPGNNTSGVSNFVALEPQLKLFKNLQPQLQNLGILYNPGEINSVIMVQQLEQIAPKFNLKIIKQAVPRTMDILQAATKLANISDAIFISNDNSMLSAMQSIIKAANAKKIPVYVSDTDAVSHGALAALGPNQYDIGLQAGTMIAQLLKGSDIAQMPVQFPQKTELYLNLRAAQLLNIKVNPELQRNAAKIISN